MQWECVCHLVQQSGSNTIFQWTHTSVFDTGILHSDLF